MELIARVILPIFAALVSRGGEPRVEAGGRYLLFPLRPGILWFAIAGIVYASWVLVDQGKPLHRGLWSQVVWWQLGIGVFTAVVCVGLLTQTLMLDQEGLRLKRVVGGSKLIRWETFSHFERYHSRSAGKATYYFRSKPQGLMDQTVTIAIPEMSYNTDRLVEEIRKRVALDEQPRVKRHWWGG